MYSWKCWPVHIIILLERQGIYCLWCHSAHYLYTVSAIYRVGQGSMWLEVVDITVFALPISALFTSLCNGFVPEQEIHLCWLQWWSGSVSRCVLWEVHIMCGVCAYQGSLLCLAPSQKFLCWNPSWGWHWQVHNLSFSFLPLVDHLHCTSREPWGGGQNCINVFLWIYMQNGNT